MFPIPGRLHVGAVLGAILVLAGAAGAQPPPGRQVSARPEPKAATTQKAPAGGEMTGRALAEAMLSDEEVGTGDFITGPAARAWERWRAAMQAILDRNAGQSEAAFAGLLELDPSPLRVALLADYTVQRTAMGGAVLLFEQDLDARSLGPSGSEVAERLLAGREQLNEAGDALYFSQIGRFDVADANLRALLESQPDAVALLEFMDQVPRRREILITLVANPTVGEAVREVLRLLDRGELTIKADPTRIKENIERLDGPPRAFENARAALQDSGEWGIPFLIQTLRKPSRAELLLPIVRTLPTIDRPAVNPLVMALRVNDQATKRYVIEALGALGYAQAVPYLLKLHADPQTPAEVRQAVDEALDALRARGVAVPPGLSVAQAFLNLAEDYYADKRSLAADPRLDTANVWYWRDDFLQNVEVPTVIFNEIMCMRCCEEALLAAPDLKPALALWLAANFRREAQLLPGARDATRPPDYPPASYFAQSAGAEYNLMVLARAVDTNDPAVAMGAIAALRATAGPASLVSGEGGRLPLAEALSLPDRMVRIRAGLTLGWARPLAPFVNYQNLMPVLSESLMMHSGARSALVVDPDAASANVVMGQLRAQGFEVRSDAALFPGLQKAREELPALDLLVVASDIRDPGLAEGLVAFRGEFRFASVPTIVVQKSGDTDLVRDLVRADHRLVSIPMNPTENDVAKAVALVSRAVGAQAVTPEIGRELALETAEVLRLLALTNNPIFPLGDAEPALLSAFGSDDLELRVAVAEVLGYLGSTEAQRVIAVAALDPDEPEDLRVRMFAALAEAAKRRGNLLPADVIQQLVALVEKDPNMALREAGSRALGALNVPGAPASEIIRNQYRG